MNPLAATLRYHAGDWTGPRVAYQDTDAAVAIVNGLLATMRAVADELEKQTLAGRSGVPPHARNDSLLEQVRALLAWREWERQVHVPGVTPALRCPVCFNPRSRGHRGGCWLRQALALLSSGGPDGHAQVEVPRDGAADGPSVPDSGHHG